MNKLNKNNKILFLLMLVTAVLFLAFLYITFSVFTTTSFINTASDSTNNSSSDQELEGFDFEIDAPDPEYGSEISNLIEVAPHYGSYFTFYFDDNDGVFYVYIDPANEVEGNKEFNQFLIENGIPSSSFFPGLNISNSPLPSGF